MMTFFTSDQQLGYKTNLKKGEQGGGCAQRGEDSKHPRPLSCHAPPHGRCLVARRRTGGVKPTTLPCVGLLRTRRVVWPAGRRKPATRRCGALLAQGRHHADESKKPRPTGRGFRSRPRCGSLDDPPSPVDEVLKDLAELLQLPEVLF